MSGFRQDQVQANGIDFHYLKIGTGPLVLCLHGFLVHLQDTFCLRCLTRSNSKEIQTLLISTSAAKVREVQQYLS